MQEWDGKEEAATGRERDTAKARRWPLRSTGSN